MRSRIKDEEDITIQIKPEITIIEDDPLIEEDFFDTSSKKSDDDFDNDCVENFADDDFESEEDENYQQARTANGRYACHLCDKTLVDANGLKLHIRLHTGNNLKRCEICDRGFSKHSHLMRHMATHNKTKSDSQSPTKIKTKKEFSDDDSTKEDDFDAEMETEGLQSDIEFLDSSSDVLIDYVAAKTSDGRYQCSYCEKTLVDSKGLKLHVRLHTGLNLKRCPICDRGFTKQNQLKRHLETHKDKVYSCEHCDETFTSNGEFKIHLASHNITIR